VDVSPLLKGNLVKEAVKAGVLLEEWLANQGGVSLGRKLLDSG
jgi:hypothetical protein